MNILMHLIIVYVWNDELRALEHRHLFRTVCPFSVKQFPPSPGLNIILDLVFFYFFSFMVEKVFI